MKMIHAACLTLFALAGCSERESSSRNASVFVQESPIDTFKDIIRGGQELVFTDTVKQGPGSEGQSIKLRFSGESKVTIEESGFGIDVYPCDFAMNSDGDLIITNQRTHPHAWPKLVISREGRRLTLSRKDGLRSFKEHGNFWPEVVDRVFPLEAKLPGDQKRS
jgi:hypothetical protein